MQKCKGILRSNFIINFRSVPLKLAVLVWSEISHHESGWVLPQDHTFGYLMVYFQCAPASLIFYQLAIQWKERNRRCVSNDQALSDIPRVPAPICLVWNTSIFHIGLRPDTNISSFPVIIIFRFHVSFAAKQSGACSWNLIIINVQLQNHLRPAPSALQNQLLLYLSLVLKTRLFSSSV